MTTAEQWAVWYGGSDADNCAGVEIWDDEADAREHLQWYRAELGRGLVRRTVRYGPWRAADPVIPPCTGEPHPHPGVCVGNPPEAPGPSGFTTPEVRHAG